MLFLNKIWTQGILNLNEISLQIFSDVNLSLSKRLIFWKAETHLVFRIIYGYVGTITLVKARNKATCTLTITNSYRQLDLRFDGLYIFRSRC